ncbi:MAG: hypothetical protein PUD02_05865, partial [Eggerthellales bacterium]|nr:hypothetical protein [Eggerthellales bacterium]
MLNNPPVKEPEMCQVLTWGFANGEMSCPAGVVKKAASGDGFPRPVVKKTTLVTVAKGASSKSKQKPWSRQALFSVEAIIHPVIVTKVPLLTSPRHQSR